MKLSMIIHVNTEVLTTVLVIPSGNKNATSSDIDRVVVNKLIIDTRIEIYSCILFFFYSILYRTKMLTLIPRLYFHGI